MDGNLTVYCKKKLKTNKQTNKKNMKKTALAFTRKEVESNTENKNCSTVISSKPCAVLVPSS